MPSQTFLALPEEKRRRVIGAAVSEFARNAYAVASLDRIAAAAGVAKGSLYQYFASKQDIYGWLLTHHLPERKRSAEPAPDAIGGDLFDWLEAAFLGGLSLFRHEPELAALGARAALPTSDPAAARVHAALHESTRSALCARLRSAKRAGSVRADVPVELAADLVSSVMGTGLLGGLARCAGATLDEVLANPARLQELPRRQLLRHVRQTTDLLRRALAP